MMPLYDIRCTHCDKVFEDLLPVQALGSLVTCPYCASVTKATRLYTIGHVMLRTGERWEPRNGAQQLAGRSAAGPGAQVGSERSSVLHNCKGPGCSICGT